MTARRSIVGLTVLCALLFSAFAAANASALGTTTWTCEATSVEKEVQFTDSHCNTPGTGKTGWKHVGIALGKFTKISVEGTSATQTLKGTIAGIPVDVSCTGVKSLEGGTENVEVGSPILMQNIGKGIKLDYTGCTVKEPAGKGCRVELDAEHKETIVTNLLTSTTVEGTTATTTGVKFSPPTSGTEAGIFAHIVITGCSVAALNGNFTVQGTAVGAPSGTGPSGSTLVFTKASTAGLLFAGQAASLEGTVTVKGENGNGLSLTTG